MRRTTQRFASNMGRNRSRRRTAVAAWLLVCAVAGVDAGALQRALPKDRQVQERFEEARRKEGEALVGLADAAMSGRASADFSIKWRNDFLKAQNGTFVPFTLTVDRSTLTAASLLMYVRAARRDAAAPARGAAIRYPFDIIFPVDLPAPQNVPTSQPIRITRGFAVPAGDYDVYVALRERAEDPLGAETRLRAAVLKQPLTVPDFWAGDLTTSTVILADRIDALPASIAGDDVLERPYVIGQNEIHPAAGTDFRKNRELIVVFLIYNPAVTAEKNFDIQVDYHLFRKEPAGTAGEAAPAAGQPAARAGERYVTRTNPQRFTPPVMGAQFDPAAGQPMLAGQGILLSSFQDGEYRLGITVTDKVSRKTVSRDVTFTVVGS